MTAKSAAYPAVCTPSHTHSKNLQPAPLKCIVPRYASFTPRTTMPSFTQTSVCIYTQHQKFNRNRATIRRDQQWYPTLHFYGLLFKFSCWQTELDFDELFDWACTCERR